MCACYICFYYKDSPDETTKLQVKLTRYCEKINTVLNANIFPHLLLIGCTLNLLLHQGKKEQTIVHVTSANLGDDDKVVRIELHNATNDGITKFFKTFENLIVKQIYSSSLDYLVIFAEANHEFFNYQLSISIMENMIQLLKSVSSI